MIENTKSNILAKLEDILNDRKRNVSEDSYVSQLYKKGNKSINLKIIEEVEKDHLQDESEYHQMISLKNLKIDSVYQDWKKKD